LIFSAFLDTNCLYPLFLRDSLLDFAQSDFYRPRWSRKVHDELRRNLEAKYPEKKESHSSMINLMNALFPDAIVEGFEHLEGSMGCIDPNDEHVLAAAFEANVGALVTFNLKDFPKNAFEEFGIEIINPDEFLLDLVDLNEKVAKVTIARRLDMYQNPGLGAIDLSVRISKSNCPGFGSWIRDHSDEIDSITETFVIARNGI
jgi:predicted nucleic acid-binding protein